MITKTDPSRTQTTNQRVKGYRLVRVGVRPIKTAGNAAGRRYFSSKAAFPYDFIKNIAESLLEKLLETRSGAGPGWFRVLVLSSLHRR